jgi:hypothetical protein
MMSSADQCVELSFLPSMRVCSSSCGVLKVRVTFVHVQQILKHSLLGSQFCYHRVVD